MDNRIIGELGTKKNDGPLLIFVGGVHGNEEQGLIALENVFSKLKTHKSEFKGRAIAIRGNLQAIAQNKRYISKDLNRIWSEAETLDENIIKEKIEFIAIKEIIEEEAKHFDTVYLLDLHTTSAPTIPFAVTSDKPLNKIFIEQFDLPFITGLSGYLDGTLLNWMCKKGHIGLAFEAGQHHSDASAIKHEAFVKLSMVYTGFLQGVDASEIEYLKDHLDDELRTKHNHFELIERYKIEEGEDFQMVEGFSNFEHIYEGEIIATNNSGNVLSKSDANIFMPLYQKQGEDGFFIIKPKKK